MNMIGQHSDEEHLESYAMGRLSDSEVETLEEHLLCCEQCRDALDETEAFIASMRGALKKERIATLPKPVVIGTRATRSWIPAYVGAFAFAAILFVVVTQAPRPAAGNPL